MKPINQDCVFSYKLIVDASLIDNNNHINNVEYLKIGLHAASTHWNYSTINLQNLQALWVVKRHEIDYINQAFEGEELLITTWINAIEGATCYRHITIVNAITQKPICNIITQWYMLDAITKKPKRVSEDVKLLFGII